MDIISTMRNSGNKLLQTEAADISQWDKLKHNKECLEAFLNYNIAEIAYKTKDGDDRSVVCTANTTLIKIMSLKRKADKQKAMKLKSSGIHTKDSTSVNVWDLVEDKMKTMSLKSWQIINFLTIREENILLLDEILHDILKKGK